MDTLETIRNRRHLAAFLGDCGITTCRVCRPVREPEWVRRSKEAAAAHGHVAVKAIR